MTKHTLISAVSTAFCVLLLTGNAAAQGDPGSTGPIPAILPPPAGVPVDGGASLLLVAGVVYSLKRLHDRQNKR